MECSEDPTAGYEWVKVSELQPKDEVWVRARVSSLNEKEIEVKETILLIYPVVRFGVVDKYRGMVFAEGPYHVTEHVCSEVLRKLKSPVLKSTQIIENK